MSSQQQSVEDVFGAALERPADQRAAFLDQACSADLTLRHLVDDLLLADERAGSFLEEPLLLQLANLPEGLASLTSETLLTHAGDPAFTHPARNLARFAAGQSIAGRFTVVRFLARGGMGEVYEVDDQLLQGARVALKAILPHIAADAGASRRFEQEVLLARKVTHPNLCPIYDIARCHDAEPPFLFLTMKLLSGETLAARLRAPDPIPYEDALALAHQITCGLAAIHAAGVIHGDIKPNNIMLEGTGRALSLSIMDFGLARLHTAEHTILTRTLIAGTPGYLAPEILRGERPSQATDLFALGVLLHRVLVGRAPETVFSSLAVQPSPDLDGPGVPAFLAEAVRGLLSELPAPRTLAFASLLARYDPAHPADTAPGRPDLRPNQRPDPRADRRKHRPYTGPDRRASHSLTPHALQPREPQPRGLRPHEPQPHASLTPESLSPAAASQERHGLRSRDSRGATSATATLASLRPHLSRRTFALGSAAACAAVAGTLAWRPELLDDLLHPLPQKRFVALVGWPAPDPRLKPMLMSLIDSIGNELARAEAFDRDLYIIPHTSAADITTPDQLNAIRDSSGANLVLAASATPAGNDLHLNFQLLDPNTPHPLRTRQITAPADQQASLLTRSLHAAATLLDIHHYTPNDHDLSAGSTTNPQAFAAFQAAETLRKQPNDTGLEAAIGKYREAVELDPRYARAYAKLALAYSRLFVTNHDAGAAGLARANCDSVLAIFPDFAEAHLAFASVLDSSGDRVGSVEQTEKAILLEPLNCVALIYHAQMLRQLDRWEEAEHFFKRAIQQRPNYWYGHNELALLFYDQGRYADAITEFRMALLNLANSVITLGNIADTYLQLGKLGEAKTYAQKSLAIKANVGGISTLASVARIEGKRDLAVRLAEKVISLDDSSAEYWLDLGDCYACNSQKQKAEHAYTEMYKAQEASLRENSFDGPGWILLALAKAKIGNANDVPSLIERGDRNFSADLYSQLAKVRTLELIHRREEALTMIAACLMRGAKPFQFETMPDLAALCAERRYSEVIRGT